MIKKRQEGLDILRAIAVIFVISVHFFLNTKFYETPIVGLNMYLQVMLQTIFMSCIPLFLMISGYVSRGVEISWNYFKKLLPVIVVYIVFSALAIAYRTLHFHEVKSIKEWITDFLTFKANPYSWYVNMYIGLFLISPFLNILFNNLKNKKERQILVAVFLFISAVPDFLNGRFSSVIQFPSYWADIYPVGFYFLGSYIREYKPQLRKLHASALFLGILAFETFFECYAAKGAVYVGYMGTFASLIRLALAAVIFIALYETKLNDGLVKYAITKVSTLSLDIYLASYVSDKVVYGFIHKFAPMSQSTIVIWMVPIVFGSFTLAFSAAILRSSLIKVRRSNIINSDRETSITS